jgi:serine/threonine protein kinase
VHTDDDVKDLVLEMEIMKNLGNHPNVIELLGSCTAGGDLWVIMEYANDGNLRDFLRIRRAQYQFQPPCPYTGQRPVTIESLITFFDLMNFAFQIICGLGHLNLKNVSSK